MNRTALRALLVKHEGIKAKPYTDTRGKLTIGVGRNLTDVGLEMIEVNYLLDNDINRVWMECSSQLASYGFGALSDARQHVLMDMVFNLGLKGILGFPKMLTAIAATKFDTAADEMLNSTWAKQVGDRATELANMMRNG